MAARLKDNKGIALIFCYFLALVLGLLGTTYCNYAINEKNLTQIKTYSSQSFYLAESGIDAALVELRNNYDWAGVTNQPLGDVGTFSVSVTSDGNRRKLVASGNSSGSTTLEQVVESYAEKQSQSSLPDKFFNYDVYGAKKVKLCDVNVNGNVIYGDKLELRKGALVNGTQTDDSTISPLLLLDFASLKALSITQGNYYDKDRLKDVKGGQDHFPSSFWFNEESQMPNVIYAESDLQIKGNFGTIGGFFLVVGSVVSKPEDTADTNIDGAGTIEGAIYTNGKLRVHAKGHGDTKGDDDASAGLITIDGNIWVGKDTHIHKNTTLTYNQDYMTAIKNLNLISEVQIITWRKLK